VLHQESWFLGQVFRLAATTGIKGLTSFSDPMPRYDISGNLYKPGHIGLIYQCTNSRYTGRATPRTLVMLRTGEVLSDRALQISCGRANIPGLRGNALGTRQVHGVSLGFHDTRVRYMGISV